MKRFTTLLTASAIILMLFCSVKPAAQTLTPSEPLTAINLPENVPGQPDKDWYIEQVQQIGVANKVPIIQVAYKTKDRKFCFETANFDFVDASPDCSTVFQVASISKVVFSYIVMRLVDKGVIDLDKPLYEYTGGVVEERFRDAVPGKAKSSAQNEEWAKLLTARIIFTHGSGLPNWAGTRETRGKAKLVFKHKPDTKFLYSGEGIHYLQRVVEHITGKTLNELAEQEVFGPLGMVSSSYKWRKEYNIIHAFGYNPNNEKVEQRGTKLAENAAYTLRTNVKDFSLFLEALMEGRGLKRETFEEMVSPQRSTNESNTVFFGLGIRVTPNSNLDYGPMWHHSGSNGDNYRAMFWIFPKMQSYCIYFTNSGNGGKGGTREQLYELFFPQYPDAEYNSEHHL